MHPSRLAAGRRRKEDQAAGLKRPGLEQRPGALPRLGQLGWPVIRWTIDGRVQVNSQNRPEGPSPAVGGRISEIVRERACGQHANDGGVHLSDGFRRPW